MEPMTLGSPGSPTSPGGSSYLPEFLVGDPVHNPHPSSPTKNPRQINPVPGTPRSLNLTVNSPCAERLQRTVQINQVEKPGGPPVIGLFDTLESTTVPTASTPTVTFQTPTQSSMLPPVTPVRNFQTDENSYAMDNWVTVFGFPPSAASSILLQFAQLGQILEHRFPPKGNWVHLHYYSRMEARRALTYHGKVLGSNTMIGVIPCQDPTIMKGQGGKTVSESPSMYFSTPNTVTSPANCGTTWADRSIVSPRGRPLNRSVHLENEVLSPQNIPVRHNGFVTKTLDYIFGW